MGPVDYTKDAPVVRAPHAHGSALAGGLRSHQSGVPSAWVGRLQLDPEVQQSLEKSFNKGFHNTRKAISDEAAILGHKEGDQYGNEAPCRPNVKRIAACQHNAPPGRTAPRSPRRYSAVVQASARVAARADSTWSAGQS
jgi:hypothetical protein